MATPEKPDFEAMYHELAEQMREVELDRDQLRRQLAFAQGDTGMCGVVDGDLLADILADSTPDEWRMDAARA